MAKVKALQTLHGSYGLAKAGETIEVSDKAAKQLVDGGLAVSVDEDSSADKSEKKVIEKIDADAKEGKSSVTVKDNTNKEKKNILNP